LNLSALPAGNSSGKGSRREEKRLAEAVDRAGGTFEKAREEYGKMEKEIGALKEKSRC